MKMSNYSIREFQLPPGRRLWLGSWTYWACQCVGWGGLVLATMGTGFTYAGHVYLSALPFALERSFAGLIASHLLRVLLLYLRSRWRGWRVITGAAAGVLLAGLAMSWPLYSIRAQQVLGHPRAPSALALFIDVSSWQLASLLAWGALYFAFTNYRRYRESRELQLQLIAAVKEAELNVLKAQINPHFLFNCLNSTWAMIPRELERPRESLTLLATLLRATLTLGDRKTVSFGEEWATVQTYLALERIRFEDRLRVESAIDPSANEWPVPPFLLQTLVENAVKFGVRARDQGGEVRVEAVVRDGALNLRVTNRGRIGSPSPTGVGLRNSRARVAAFVRRRCDIDAA
jgi:hypothetical protein